MVIQGKSRFHATPINGLCPDIVVRAVPCFHGVVCPLEEMKKRKERMFSNYPAARNCIEKATTPPEVGACISAGINNPASPKRFQ
jgi:hypothetical protein